MYGVVTRGSGVRWLTANEKRLPRPDTGSGDRALERQRGQVPTGGWIQNPHDWHRMIRSSPTAPPAQKYSVAVSIAGSARYVVPFVLMPPVDRCVLQNDHQAAPLTDPAHILRTWRQLRSVGREVRWPTTL
jgi:hypothetical protein